MRSHLRFALAIVAASQAPGALAFTAEQAAAGRAAYEQTCANCHGPTLRQLPNALLAGTEFVGRWGNRATSDLIAQARSTMPPDNPGGLPAETYANVVAYLLQANGGAAERERDRRQHDGAHRPRPDGPSRRRGCRRHERAAGADRRHRRGDGAAVHAGHRRDAARPGGRRLADAAPRLQRDELQPADGDHARQRAATDARVDLADARRRHESTRAGRARRHDLSREHGRHHAGARCAHRQPDLGAPRRRRDRAARHHALPEHADLPERRRVGRAARKPGGSSPSTHAPARRCGTSRCRTSTRRTAVRSSPKAC